MLPIVSPHGDKNRIGIYKYMYKRPPADDRKVPANHLTDIAE
jgi:hypothetical protein